MIKVRITDGMTPLLQELVIRSYGLAQESLQVAGSKVADAARAKMGSMSHHWFNGVVNGTYQEWRSKNGTKELGVRISHKEASSNSYDSLGAPAPGPRSMQSLIGFYLAPHSLTVVVGGAHPTFRPIKFKDGMPAGYYGKSIGAVGKKGRAILNKMNTGEPGSVGEEGVPYRAYGFMLAGKMAALPEINGAIAKRFKKSFVRTANVVHPDPVVRDIV